MPKETPVAYAEKTLGVHDAYRAAGEAATQLEKALEERISASNAIRDLRETLAEAEAELTTTERAANSEMSATAFHSHIKVVLQQDDDMIDLRRGLMDAQASYEDADNRVTQYQTRVRIETSRMDELGGYFNYLSAAKIASMAAKDTRGDTRDT